ncbi:MAG: hypothetical protein CMJ28_04355 [Phycisphaerae bacterium]|nr:hypothetical protein [Phycisphaerae bacterium]
MIVGSPTALKTHGSENAASIGREREGRKSDLPVRNEGRGRAIPNRLLLVGGGSIHPAYVVWV